MLIRMDQNMNVVPTRMDEMINDMFTRMDQTMNEVLTVIDQMANYVSTGMDQTIIDVHTTVTLEAIILRITCPLLWTKSMGDVFTRMDQTMKDMLNST